MEKYIEMVKSLMLLLPCEYQVRLFEALLARAKSEEEYDAVFNLYVTELGI